MTKYQGLKKGLQKIEQKPESHQAVINIYGGLSFADICSAESMREIWGDDPS
jgi:hypothetical protein